MRSSAWWQVAVLLAAGAGAQLAYCDDRYTSDPLAFSYDYNDADIDLSDNYEDDVVETSPALLAALDTLTRVRRYDSSKDVEDMLKKIFENRNLKFPTRVMIPEILKTTVQIDKDDVTEESSSRSNLTDTEYPTDDVEAMTPRDLERTGDVTEESTVASSDNEDTEYPMSNVEDATRVGTSRGEDRQVLRQNTDEDYTNTITSVMVPESFKSTIAMYKDDETEEISSEVSSIYQDTEFPTGNVEDIMQQMRRNRPVLRVTTPDTTTTDTTDSTTTTTSDSADPTTTTTTTDTTDSTTTTTSDSADPTTTTTTTDTTDSTTTTTSDSADPTSTTTTDTTDSTTTTTSDSADPTTTTTTDTTDPTTTTTSDSADPTTTTTSDSADPTTTITSDSADPTTTTTSDSVDPTTTTTSDTADTTITTTVSSPFDLKYLLELIGNLSHAHGEDVKRNLTAELNATLFPFILPTCPTTVTTTEATTTPLPDYSLANATIMGKCFVCGLDTLRVPQFAHCADAFAGDFLPLTPVDTRAKGQIANFRKYCRYRDVDHYVLNASQPRSIFGRWTGGCSVRWVDLSGIYTQRSCRNEYRPVLGMHYASKRMAKLELALTGLENGCIVSPMATLVPFSRGISLFARFHACVCTGSWCNTCAVHQPWMLRLVLLTFFIIKDLVK